MTTLLIIGLVLAIATPRLIARFGVPVSYLLASYPAGGFIWGLTRLGETSTTEVFEWMPTLGIEFFLRLDAFGLMFWMLISGIGALILIYSTAYMKDRESLGRLQSFLLAFMVSMLGVVASGNIVTLFVFWEATSITSFLLIGFKTDSTAGKKSAAQALIITGGGGLVLLVGLLLLQKENATSALHLFESSSPLAFMLVAIGCMAKSAQFPFHFWLPDAMAAPTPVSAYLHSATMVKAGVFLLAKLSPAIGYRPELVAAGAVTLVWGSILSLREFDLKRILAWSTVAALGSMVMLIGIATEKAMIALVVTIIAHAAYKGALFMVAGTIDLTVGTRDLRELGGLAKVNPVLAGIAALAGLSMAGVIPFLGFVKKELGLAAASQLPVTISIIIGGMASVVVSYIVCYRPFWSNRHTDSVNRLPVSILIGSGVLALLGFAGGAGIHFLNDWVAVVTQSFNPGASDPHLVLWHGFNKELLLSVLTVGLGIAGCFVWIRFRANASDPSHNRMAIQSVLGQLYSWLILGGRRIESHMVGRSFRQHMKGYFLWFVVLAVSVYTVRPFRLALPEPQQILINEAIVIAAAVVACLTILIARTRMGTVAVLGVVGVAIAMTYVTFSAPDLALTQILIDVLTVVLFVLVFAQLPRFTSISKRSTRVWEAIIATAFGLVMTTIVVGVLNLNQIQSINSYYAENSYALAYGRNVVNTIIVDFRALDTLGEITVLCVAALGVHTLIRLRPPKDSTRESSA